ncbi:MAG: hypothetical protein NC400_06560 [Clostridium sp.]|nr:hypothetical protein [Clostridium sp.]
MERKRKLILNLILTGIFFAYLIFNGVLLMRHELWRDEANVWLIARELSPVQLFAEIKYQGHPCLWYLIVMPFAKMGLPFKTIGVISYCIMAITAGIYLFKAPLCAPVKIVSLFSPVFSYFYADIARNYCLIALILVLLAVCYPKRNERPVLYGLLLGLLVQADTIALMAAGMISLMWLWENVLCSIREKSGRAFLGILKGIWIPLASLFLWIAQFYQVSDSPEFQLRAMGAGEFLGEMRRYCLWILERLSGMGEGFCVFMLLAFLLLFLAASIWQKNGWAMIVMTAAYLFEAAFSIVVYQLHIWHFIALCFVLIWALWILYSQKKDKGPSGKGGAGILIGIQTLFLMLAVCMFFHWNSEEEASNLDNALHGLYSDGEGAASYIRDNISSEELILSDNVSMASSVLAHLPDYEFYYAGNGQKAVYADYGAEQSREISWDETLSWVERDFLDKEEFYLLGTEGSCITDRERLSEYEILYQTGQETARGEEYQIYRVRLRP